MYPGQLPPERTINTLKALLQFPDGLLSFNCFILKLTATNVTSAKEQKTENNITTTIILMVTTNNIERGTAPNRQTDGNDS